jgi:hypothetical protein
MEFPMTLIQAKAIEKARREFVRASKELRTHRLSETAYRGVPTISERKEAAEVHGTFIYRGRTYTK